MTKRTYAIIGLVVVLVIAGTVVAQWQRAKKTAELLDDLDSDNSDVAVDTLHELKKRGHAVQDELITRLSSQRRKERMRAALLLGEIGTPEKAGPALEALLDDEWPPARRAAATSLGRLEYAPAVPRLLAMVQDEEEDMDSRCLAVQSVALLAQRSLNAQDQKLCVLPLINILERRPEVPPKEEEEEEAAEEEATAEEEAAAEEEELEEEAPPPDTEIELRKECVLALGLLATPEALEAVRVSTDDTVEPSALVRQYACMALEDLAELPADEVLTVKLGQSLLRALEDEAADVRMAAARALARHTDFGEEGLDSRINDKLKEMARELAEEGEPGYWVRAAARSACDRRQVNLEEAEPQETSTSS